MENGIYVCKLCGNIVEQIYVGGGELVCCGQPMELKKENTVDASLEKHVPVIEDLGNGKIKVVVGAVLHPMEDKHYIMFVEAIAKNGVVYRKNLKPGDAPVVEFNLAKDEVETVREYCNLHGLWVAK